MPELEEARGSLLEAEGKLVSANAGAPRDTSASSPKAPREAREAPPEAPTPKAAELDDDRSATEHLAENVAGPLCYLLGWLSGLLFLFIDHRPFVRYHAAQSVAVFATPSIAMLAFSGAFLGALLPHAGGVLLAIRRILELTWLVAAVLLMLKAAGGQRARVPVAAGYADRAAHAGR